MTSRRIKRVAVVAIQNDLDQSLVSNFADAFRGLGGEVVATQMTTPATENSTPC